MLGHGVIFGCGYLGRLVASRALREGYAVTALTRNPSTATELREAGLTVIEARLETTEWHAALPGRVDWAVNCVSAGGGGLDGYRHSYLEGMRSVVRWAEGAGVGTLVYTGSTSVYPQNDGSWVDESAGHEGVGPTGQILLEAEVMLREWSAGRWCILRLSGLYGPGRHHLLDQVREGRTVFEGSGETYLNLLRIEDATEAVWKALHAPSLSHGQIFNAADGHPAPKREVVAWLARQLGKPEPVFDAAQASAGGRRLFGGPVPNRCIANGKLRALLDWHPKFPDYQTGFADLLQW